MICLGVLSKLEVSFHLYCKFSLLFETENCAHVGECLTAILVVSKLRLSLY